MIPMTPESLAESPQPPKSMIPPAVVDGPYGECAHCGRSNSSPEPWTLSTKRRLEDGDGMANGGEVVPLRPRSVPPPGGQEWEAEVEALREEVAEQQRTIQELCEELDLERSVSSISADEAMTMILKLQREKAEALLDARQFKRFAEERMDQDQQEITELEQDLKTLNDELEECRQEVDMYRQEVDAYKQELEVCKEETEEYKQELELSKQAVEEYKMELEASKQAMEGYKQEMEEYERRRVGKQEYGRRVDRRGVDEPVESEQEDNPGTGTDVRGTTKGADEFDRYESSPSAVDVTASQAEDEHVEERAHLQPQEEEEEEEEPRTKAAAIGGSDDKEEEHHLSRTSIGTEGSIVQVAHASSDDGHQDVASSVMVVDRALNVKPDPARADDDESTDRVYTIDAVHGFPVPDPPATVPNQSASGVVVGEDVLRMLQMRLLALEDDLRSIRPDPRAPPQQVSLWEMLEAKAQLFCEAKSKVQHALQRWSGQLKTPGLDWVQFLNTTYLYCAHLLKTPYVYWGMSMIPLLKWIVPLLFYRRKRDDVRAITCPHKLQQGSCTPQHQQGQ